MPTRAPARPRRPLGRVVGLGRDRGSALLTVIGTMAVLSMILLSSLAYVLNTTAPTRRDQDAKIALSAAQAGLDEYVSRLNANQNYWTKGNVDATNPAFTTGRTVQGTGTAGASYSYKLLTSVADTTSQGIIRLRVTGASAPGNGTTPVKRTITATLSPTGFLSFIYLSDIEVVDPTLAGSSSNCANYYYGTATFPNGRKSLSTCSEIQWTGGDTVNGPLHSNDALQINGAVKFLNRRVESSWPALSGQTASASFKTWWGTQGYPLGGNPPYYAASLQLPTANDSLIQDVAPDVDGDGQVGPGCYYQGFTRIIFQGTTMKVLSPSTRNAATPTRCYNVNTPTTEQTVAIPPVIYVDESTSSLYCTLANMITQLGYPSSSESYSVGTSTAFNWGNGPNWTCTRGSVLISGNADAQTTVAAADDVVVTANLSVTGGTGGTDMIGLIGGNYVWVYHPVTAAGANVLSTPVTSIQAAILALNHSFVVQNWSKGSALGTLGVTGAIAQKFRGPVGTSSNGSIVTGYYKNYVYDGRLAYLSPPYYLQPVNSPWAVSSVTDN